MRRAHFRAHGGRFGRPAERTATVTIDGPLFIVRPLRRRRTYELPLAAVAQWVIEHVTRREVAERRRAKRRSKDAPRSV